MLKYIYSNTTSTKLWYIKNGPVTAFLFHWMPVKCMDMVLLSCSYRSVVHTYTVHWILLLFIDLWAIIEQSPGCSVSWSEIILEHLFAPKLTMGTNIMLKENYLRRKKKNSSCLLINLSLKNFTKSVLNRANPGWLPNINSVSFTESPS